MGLYEYERMPVNRNSYTVSEPANTDGIQKYDLFFCSPFPTGIEKNDTVYAHVFQKLKKFPAEPGIIEDMLILVHGFATKDSRLNNYQSFAASMAERGIVTVFVNLPFHINRTPKGESSGKRLISFDDMQTLEFFHQAVVDIRRLIDISISIFKPSNIYLCGISMGCMISTIVMAFDKRIDKAALLIGGGNWEEIHWKGVLRYILNGDCSRNSTNGTRVECSKAYRNFPAFLEQFKNTEKSKLDVYLSKLENLKQVTPKACFLCDPMAFGHMVDPDKVLMINSRFDLYFSRRSARYLWQELGRPEIRWINNLHSSKILKNKRLQKIIYEFYVR